MIPDTLRGKDAPGYGTPNPIVSQARILIGTPLCSDISIRRFANGTTNP